MRVASSLIKLILESWLEMSTGWSIGFFIAAVITVLVVVLLLLCIRWSHRAAVKAESILSALQESRENTEVMWAVKDVNTAIRDITDHAGGIRTHLAGKHLGS